MAISVTELGEFEETRNGVPLKFKITTVPPEIKEDVVEHMVTYFLKREPLCKHYKLHEDPEEVKAVRDVWLKTVDSGVSIVAIAEGPGKINDRIIGCNMLYIASKDDEDLKVDTPKFKKVYDMCIVVLKQSNVFDIYGVDKFLSAFGLSVHPDYHGYRIGERLLQSRKPLCQKLGIKLTGTIFTASASQYISKKIGFKVIDQEEYDNFSLNGEIAFKGLEGCYEYSVWVFE